MVCMVCVGTGMDALAVGEDLWGRTSRQSEWGAALQAAAAELWRQPYHLFRHRVADFEVKEKEAVVPVVSDPQIKFGGPFRFKTG